MSIARSAVNLFNRVFHPGRNFRLSSAGTIAPPQAVVLSAKSQLFSSFVRLRVEVDLDGIPHEAGILTFNPIVEGGIRVSNNRVHFGNVEGEALVYYNHSQAEDIVAALGAETGLDLRLPDIEESHTIVDYVWNKFNVLGKDTFRPGTLPKIDFWDKRKLSSFWTSIEKPNGFITHSIYRNSSALCVVSGNHGNLSLGILVLRQKD